MNERPTPMRIAMWSGPRNISTAMMRAWGNRPDTFVCDEPFYAYYLKMTGAGHPFAEEIIEHHEDDAKAVIDWLTGEVPNGKAVFYQKQMTHHLLPGIDRDWIGQVTNCFLIREPRELITSYIKKMPNPTLEDLGMPQQVEIFESVRTNTGTIPPVLDAKDVLDDPPRMLALLCEALELPFTESMLSWPPGPRATDGVWAKHWYDRVVETTTFAPYRPKPDEVPPELEALHRECQNLYDRLYEHRLR